jgi:hypothetical protein
MNYTKLFYWLTVADNAKTFFGITIAILTIAVVVCIIAFVSISSSGSYYGEPGKLERTNDFKLTRKYFFPFLVSLVLFWSLYIFTPSKKDALLIVAGGQTMNFLTTDSTATQIPHEVLNFVVSELKYMAEEAKVDLGVSSAKDKILEEAKEMTSEELLKKINEDENFRKIVLDK